MKTQLTQVERISLGDAVKLINKISAEMQGLLEIRFFEGDVIKGRASTIQIFYHHTEQLGADDQAQ